MELLTKNNNIELAWGVKDVHKKSPICGQEIMFEEVYFNQVTSKSHNGHTVYIEMLDPYYYRIW